MKHKRIELPSLPYAYNALSPVISEEIMTLHHTRHHLAYVTGANAAMDKLEKARAGEGFEIDHKATMRDLSFHLSGHKLHSIFWANMQSPKENNLPTGTIAEAIDLQFGSFDSFKTEFAAAAKSVEGSGWAVLIKDDEDLHVMQVQNHNLLSVIDSKVILALDVWEHAYYLDYKNDRAAYVDKWFSLVNWDNVSSLL